MVLAAVTGLLVSCSSASPGPAPGTESVGVDTAELQAVFQDAAAVLDLPGAFMLLRSPQGEVISSYGTTEPGEESEPSPEQHLRVGSITKTWTGTVILQLAQDFFLLPTAL